MIRLKTHIGSKFKPGQMVEEGVLDARLVERLIAEGRAERVKASDQTAEAFRAAVRELNGAVVANIRTLNKSLADARPEELETVFESQRAPGDPGEGADKLYDAVFAALDAHRAALAADAEAEAAAKAKQDSPPAKGGKTNTGETSSGTPRKGSSTASSGAVEGRASRATPNTAKAGGRTEGKPGADKAKAKPASGEPSDQKRSGAEAARGTHNPEAGGSNPPSAPSSGPEADKA